MVAKDELDGGRTFELPLGGRGPRGGRTAAERQAALEARKRAQGLTRIAAWVPTEIAEQVKEMVADMARQWQRRQEKGKKA